MKRENISKVIGNLNEEHISEAENYSSKKKQSHSKAFNIKIYVAACLILCLLVGVGLWHGDLFNSTPPSISDESPTVSEEDYETIDTIDTTSEYTVSNTIIDSVKAEISKFDVNMTVNISTVDEFGVASMNRTSKIPLDSNNITLEIVNDNEEIFIVCSGFWRLEKYVDGMYREVVSSDYAATSSCGPKSSCYVLCDLNKYSSYIGEGKYRIISPTLNIAKETEDGLKDYTYQNERAFILYSEFEFVK